MLSFKKQDEKSTIQKEYYAFDRKSTTYKLHKAPFRQTYLNLLKINYNIFADYRSSTSHRNP